MSVYIVGLTGGIGSGKSTVADLFAEQGVVVVDTDQIAHALTGPEGAAMPAIVAEFGAQAARADGALDRVAMRQRVFADADARRRLEAILHPLIASESARQATIATSPYAILAVPLLVETGNWQQRCDRVLVVDCPEEIQLQRVMARNGLSAAEVRVILAAQASRAQRLAAADDVIANDDGREKLKAVVEKLHESYLNFGKAKILHADR